MNFAVWWIELDEDWLHDATPKEIAERAWDAAESACGDQITLQEIQSVLSPETWQNILNLIEQKRKL